MSTEDDSKQQLTAVPLTAPLGDSTAQIPKRTLTGGEIEGWLPGTHLGGQYRLIDLLGDGGMGAVYLARDVLLGRRVAIKSLRPPKEIAHDPRARAEYIQMFQRDATSTARLNHPNIVTIHNTGVHEGIPFMVLEYLDGESLDETLARGPIDEHQASQIAATLARALSYAHERGVIHRDIKPANIFLTNQGQVKLLDFGVALIQMKKVVDAEDADISAEELRARIGQGSTIAGTPAYMAPEQLIGDMQDHRVDIWAAGVVLYEMLTGARPSPSPTHTVNGMLDFAPLEPFHEEIQQIIRACLQKSPQLRLGTTATLARRLEQANMRMTTPVPAVQLPQNKTLLPEVSGEFLGRDVEIEQLLEHFSHPSGPLLTITGAPGVGKSRLAVELAQRASSVFTLTAHLDLHPCRSLLDVPRALAMTMGHTDVKMGTGTFQQLDLLLETTDRMLIVLDGLREDATWGDELLDFFLSHERRPEILLTSRRPLGVRGEVVYLLTTLSLPTLEEDGEALRLYYSMLPEEASHILDSKEGRAQARELMSHLDGLPLAIELAARRASVLPPSAILDRLDRIFELLRPIDRNTSTTSVEALLDDAWDRLPREEKIALSLANLFEGPFSLEAAEVVIGEIRESYDDLSPLVIDLCEELVNRSMLVERETPSGVLQFEIPSLTRAFVRKKSKDVLDGYDRLEARIRHAEHFASGEDFLDTSTLDERHDLLDVNRANLRAAIETSLDERDPDGVASLLLLLGEVCLERGELEQVRGALERSSHLLQLATRDLQVSLDILQSKIALATSERSRALEFASRALAASARARSRSSSASAHAHYLLARSSWYGGDREGADALLERARADARGDAVLVIDIMLLRAEIAMDAHDFDRATSLARQARDQTQTTGSLRRIAQANDILARHRWRLGDLRRARAIYQETLTRGIKLMRDDLEVIAHKGLGMLAIYEDEHQLANAHLNRALTIHGGAADKCAEELHGLRAELLSLEGKLDLAIAAARRALELASTREERRAITRWSALVADLTYGLGEHERAEEQWRSILEDAPPLLLGAERELYWNIRVNMARQYHLGSSSERAWEILGEVVQEIERASAEAGPRLAHALRLASTSFT